MNHEHFVEMQRLMEMDPSETTHEQEDRLADLLDLHDAGMAYFGGGEPKP